jgi:DNA polymerase-3 subunit alpha/error-prone DNA polymerase
VENSNGFKRLCEILSSRSKDKENFNPLSMLTENAEGLILSSPNANVLTSLNGKVKRLYASITPSLSSAIPISRTLNIPLCFLDDSIFLNEEDIIVHKVLRAIGLLKTVGNLKAEDLAKQERVMRPPLALNRITKSWPEAFKGAQEIADLCRFDTLFDGWIFPDYKITDGSSIEELRRRVYEGAEARYGELGDGEIERITYELDIIDQKGFAPYFLTMDDIVKMSPRTCGRGSGAASVVSYSLGITNVDPIKHKLYFERFLNPARTDPPDIDVDFSWDERDDLIKEVIKRFGPDHCARVANHNFFRFRGALRETAKAYGVPDAVITRMERHLFDTGDTHNTQDSLWQEIFTVAKRIEGLPHGLGMHCGGLVITPEPIYQYAPVERSAEGYPLIVWEKDGVESRGFVKIDLLGNRSLAVIRDTLASLEEQGIIIDRNTWHPSDDEETIKALARGDSIGVFYIESPAMRQLQRKTNAGDFEHIIIHSSIIRPAANKFITEYVKRLKGKKWDPLHPRLEKILDETYGILCYQEDVSKVAMALAGFNEADADKLRKVIAKKAGGSKLAVYEKQFFEGCRKNDVADDKIDKVWGMMLSFDGYSFCKPHSASYAMVSYQSAYLRVHYPAHFMASVISNQGGYYRPHAYIAESRRMGLLVEGPDVNLSRWKYYGKGRSVMVGLMAIKGLSRSGGESILNERECGGDYKSLEDFSRRVSLSRDDIVALCPAGVFDSISSGLTRTLQARRLLSYFTGTTKKGVKELFMEIEKQPINPIISEVSISSTKQINNTNKDL